MLMYACAPTAIALRPLIPQAVERALRIEPLQMACQRPQREHPTTIVAMMRVRHRLRRWSGVSPLLFFIPILLSGLIRLIARTGIRLSRGGLLVGAVLIMVLRH
jgi:hypothetical protein